VCLILAAWQAAPGYRLVVAANRDEFHARTAAPAQFWQDRPAILAGRDLQAMGTWMGVDRRGRFAAVTNYRGAREPSAPHSRGALVTGFLANGHAPAAYVRELKPEQYSGFNLLLAAGEDFWWLSNRDGSPRALHPGVYGLGNLLLDSPEVEGAKKTFGEALADGPAVESLFEVLAAARIVHPVYGTRCSTVLIIDERVRYAERVYTPDGEAGETRHFEFSPAP
jgi:uncharacterized protein with NRDE domain